eukprot:4504406-Pyramimonas_sp.AAC.1
MRAPPAVINIGVDIGGRHADGVTYRRFLLNTKFANLGEERLLNPGTALIEFRAHAGERIDQALARFETARVEADAAGSIIPNFQIP